MVQAGAVTAEGALCGTEQKRRTCRYSVLDLSRILAGPTATQLLGESRPEVIKVERPVFGDDTRALGPPFVPGAEGADSDLSAIPFRQRNKKSIAIDITDKAQVELVKKLVRSRRRDRELQAGRTSPAAASATRTWRASNPTLVWCSHIRIRPGPAPIGTGLGYDFLIQQWAG
ncbi:hypothetical protein F2981_25385 (plasmid) [Sinorhizobium meliloti]|nr:hypothetical protein [Sinorhizobium meliloti]